MMEMIAQYDIQAAIDAAVQQEMREQALQQRNESIEETIRKLAIALQDRKKIEAMWPNAPVDADLFAHLELDIDLRDGEVTAETAARDIYGNPLFSHLFDLKPAQGALMPAQAPQGALMPAQIVNT